MGTNRRWLYFIFFILTSSFVIISSSFLIKGLLKKRGGNITKNTNEIPCPVPKNFCKTAITITQGNISKVGYKLPVNTPILSVGKGVIRSGATGGGKLKIPKHPLLFQENEEGKNFTYEFFGSHATPSASLVEKGIEIGKTSETPEVWFNLYNINLIIGLEQNRKALPLKKEDMEQ